MSKQKDEQVAYNEDTIKKKLLNVKQVMKSMNKVKEYEPTMITLEFF